MVEVANELECLGAVGYELLTLLNECGWIGNDDVVGAVTSEVGECMDAGDGVVEWIVAASEVRERGSYGVVAGEVVDGIGGGGGESGGEEDGACGEWWE